MLKKSFFIHIRNTIAENLLFSFYLQTELPVPEQYKTTIAGKTLKTVCVDSLG